MSATLIALIAVPYISESGRFQPQSLAAVQSNGKWTILYHTPSGRSVEDKTPRPGLSATQGDSGELKCLRRLRSGKWHLSGHEAIQGADGTWEVPQVVMDAVEARLPQGARLATEDEMAQRHDRTSNTDGVAAAIAERQRRRLAREAAEVGLQVVTPAVQPGAPAAPFQPQPQPQAEAEVEDEVVWYCSEVEPEPQELLESEIVAKVEANRSIQHRLWFPELEADEWQDCEVAFEDRLRALPPMSPFAKAAPLKAEVLPAAAEPEVEVEAGAEAAEA